MTYIKVSSRCRDNPDVVLKLFRSVTQLTGHFSSLLQQATFTLYLLLDPFIQYNLRPYFSVSFPSAQGPNHNCTAWPSSVLAA